MKVISGILKGRNIKGYDIVGTRPTMDRVKESLFAMIQDDIRDSMVLDLFAGSGSLGIEAISNGAEYSYFVDNNIEVIKVLNENISNFNIKNKSKVLHMDYNKALKYFKENNIKFDIIFIDPPYDYKVIDKVIRKITEFDILNDDALVIIEYKNKFSEITNLSLYKEKKYADKYISINKILKSATL